MKIGSSKPDAKGELSNVIKNEVTVCGKETLKALKPEEPIVYNIVADGISYEKKIS